MKYYLTYFIDVKTFVFYLLLTKTLKIAPVMP